MAKESKNKKQGLTPKNWIGAMTVMTVICGLLIISITGFLLDWYWMLWGSVLAFISFIIFALALSSTIEMIDRRRIKLSKEAIDTEGKVLSCIKIEPSKIAKPFISTRYRCIVLLKGDIISSAGRRKTSCEVGEKVKVRHLPQNPENCIILDEK